MQKQTLGLYLSSLAESLSGIVQKVNRGLKILVFKCPTVSLSEEKDDSSMVYNTNLQ